MPSVPVSCPQCGGLAVAQKAPGEAEAEAEAKRSEIEGAQASAARRRTRWATLWRRTLPLGGAKEGQGELWTCADAWRWNWRFASSRASLLCPTVGRSLDTASRFRAPSASRDFSPLLPPPG